MRVKTKAQMFRLIEAGQFGNALRTCATVENAREEGITKDVGIRSITTPGWPYFKVLPTLEEAEQYVKSLPPMPDEIRYCEGDQGLPRLNQGEFMINPVTGQWTYFYSDEPLLYMRGALKVARHIHGAKAYYLLKSTMTPSSWEDFLALVDLHPAAVIELSVYCRTLGPLLGRNTIIWEVRNY